MKNGLLRNCGEYGRGGSDRNSPTEILLASDYVSKQYLQAILSNKMDNNADEESVSLRADRARVVIAVPHGNNCATKLKGDWRGRRGRGWMRLKG